jgi:hypothetical protein
MPVDQAEWDRNWAERKSGFTEEDIVRLFNDWQRTGKRARLRRLHYAIGDVLGNDGDDHG